MYGNVLCIGASVVVCLIIVVEICVNIVLLYDKYNEFRRRRRMGVVNYEW